MAVTPGLRPTAGVLVASLRLLVYCGIFSSCALFFVQLFFFRAPFWSSAEFNSVLSVNITRLTKIRTKLDQKNLILLNSTVNKEFIFWWGGILAAAILSIWLKCWPFNLRLPVDRSLQQSFSSGKAAVVKAMKTQVPPRRFWTWLLQGGLNFIDLAVILLWAGAMLTIAVTQYTQYMSSCNAKFNKTGKWCYTTLVGTRLGAAGLGAGFALASSLMLVFLPIPRASFLEYLLGADFFTLIKYHRWLGHGTMLVLLTHWICFYSQFIYNGTWVEEALDWTYSGVNYLAGSIAGLCAMLLWVTTISYIRRNHFNIFLAGHIIGYLGIVIFGMAHWTGFGLFLPALVLYIMDLVYRLSQWGVISDLHCSFICETNGFATISITFLRGSDVKACNVVFLNVPIISAFEWHPVTIAAVIPDEDGFSSTAILHMKTYGTWTQNLVKLLREQPEAVKVRADGPYGSSSPVPVWAAHDMLLLIAGGVGITPLLGVVREVVAARREAEKNPGKGVALLPKRVQLVWAVRKLQELDMLDQATVDAVSEGWLQLELFWTSAPSKDNSVALKHSLVPRQLSPKSGVMEPHVRHLPPYKVSDLQWAATHVLAMVGAFAGIVMARAFTYERTISSAKGVASWEGGLLNLLFLVICGMGLPALLIYPMQRFRYRQHVRACQAAQSQMPITLDSIQQQPHLPDKNLESMESDGGVEVCVRSGRPNLEGIVLQTAKGMSAADRCVVCASGPTQLERAAFAACAAANQALKDSDGPHLAFESHSFAL